MKKQRTYTAREVEKLLAQRTKELNTKKSKTPKVTKLSNNPREKLLRKQIFKDLHAEIVSIKKPVKAKKAVAKVAKKPKKKLPIKKVNEHQSHTSKKTEDKPVKNLIVLKKEAKKKTSSNFLLKILNSFKRKRNK